MKKLICLSLILLTTFSFGEEAVKLYLDKKDSNNIQKSVEQIKLNLDTQGIISELVINDEYKNSKIDATELGLVNIISPSINEVNNKYNIKDLEIFNLPYLLNNYTKLNKFLNSRESELLLNTINEQSKNVIALSFWPSHYKTLILKDDKVLKNSGENFLIDNSIVDEIFIKNINNSNIVLKDSVKNKSYATTINEYKNEDNKNIYYITNSNYAFDIRVILVNKRWFNSLKDSQKNFLKNLVKNLTNNQENYTIEENTYLLNDMLVNNKLKLNGLTESDKLLLKKAATFAHSYYYENINKDLLVNTYNNIK